MKTSPGAAFDAQLSAATRNVTFTLMLDIDGVMTDMSSHVKNIMFTRSAGSAKAVASFTAAMASEMVITLTPSNVALGTVYFNRMLTLSVGFNGEEVSMFVGSIRKVRRSALQGTCTITALDYALSLTRTGVETPAMFNVNSALYIREILENAGVTSRVGAPNELLFALDFDSHSVAAVTSARKAVSDTDDNGVNQSLIEPNMTYGLNMKNYLFRDDGRSGQMTIMPLTIVQQPDRALTDSDLVADPKRILTADNASGSQGLTMPAGYGASVINPTVLKFGSPLFGYSYWASFQARRVTGISDYQENLWKSNGYTAALAEAKVQGLEGDPIVLVSIAGITWTTSTAAPLATRPTYSKNTKVKYYDKSSKKYVTRTIASGEEKLGVLNCEATVFYDGTKLHCIWRQVNGKNDYWYYRSTTDGSTWTSAQRWRTAAIGALASPSFVKDAAGVIHVWWVDKNANPNVIRHSTCASIGGTVEPSDKCKIDTTSTEDVWRISVINDSSGVGFNACVTLCDRNKNMTHHRIKAAASMTGTEWQLSNRLLVKPDPLSMDAQGVQGGTLVNNYDTVTNQVFTMWYSGKKMSGSYGLGTTDVYLSPVTWEGSIPQRASFGPVVWGPMVVTKCIDGITPADMDALWPTNNTTDGGAHVVSFGGWFSFPDGNVWSSTPKVAFMAADFGTNLKAILYKTGSSVWASIYKYAAGTWTLVRAASFPLSGITWAPNEQHFVGAEIKLQWDGGNANPTLNLRAIVDGVAGSWTSLVNDSKCAGWGGLTGVELVTPLSSQITSTYTTAFPGMTYDNLFVKLGSIPAIIPAAQYHLDPGLNRLLAAAYRGTDPWSEMKSIAESELGCMYYNSDGKLFFFNRQHFTNPNNTAATPVQLTIDNALKDCGLDDDIANVRNIVRVKIKDVNIGQARDVWKLDSPLVIPAGQSVTYDIAVSGVLESCDVVASGTSRYGSTRYRASVVQGYDGAMPIVAKNGANDSAGGAEGYITVSIIPFGRCIRVVLTNSHSKDIALMDGNGNHYMYVWGRIYTDARFRSTESPVVTKESAASIATYGANEVEVDLAYVTTTTDGESLSDYVLKRYENGIKKLDNIEIVGNPLLELGDRSEVIFGKFSIDDVFWIERIEDTISPDAGYSQRIDLSVADSGDWFILDTSMLDDTPSLMY